MQPLARLDDAGERAWAAEWVAALLAREAVSVTPELKEHLWSALTSLASAPLPERTITGLSVLLQSNALKQALQPYTVGGPWGRLLDAETERLGEADVQAFETEGLIGAGAAPAVLSYLFHRIGDRLDGRPTLLIIDEGWLALDDRGFAEQLREWLKTLRKKNASVIFATQSLADIDGSAIAPSIIESCPTRLFLPNERALEPQIAAIYRRFGLNDRQIEILSRSTPKRDYYCQSRRGNRLFELGLSEVALAFTAASSKSDQKAIAEIVAAQPHEGFAAAWLKRKGLDWAADMIATQLRRPHNELAFAFDWPSRPASPRSPSPHAPARAQWVVFDPTNYAQNVLTAARELQQVNNEIQSLQNQATSLINQAKNLASLPYSSLDPAPAVDQPDRATPDPGAADRLQRHRRQSGLHSDLPAGLFEFDLRRSSCWRALQTRWQNALAGFQDAMRVQAGVVQNLSTTRTQIAGLVSSSQGASGALQAAQSGNQLVALQTTQLADLTAVMAAIARAQSLEGARNVANQAQAQQQLTNFLSYGPGYQPGAAQMFH